jgi:hypothetical protein
MATASEKLIDLDPRNPQWRVSFAYATRRFRSIETGKKIQWMAQTNFPKEAIIKYNLACYESVLGNLDAAKKYVKKCFEIEPNWRLEALEDEDEAVVGFLCGRRFELSYALHRRRSD